MLLQEVIDNFDVYRNIEYQKTGKNSIDIPIRVKALWLSEAMQDVTQRVKEGINYYSPVAITGQTVYPLPLDFSMLQSAGYPANTTSGQVQTEFDVVDVSDIQVQPTITVSGSTTGLVSQCAITSIGGQWFIS